MSIPITKDVTTTKFVFECVLRACLSSVLLPCNTTPGGAPSLAIDTYQVWKIQFELTTSFFWCLPQLYQSEKETRTKRKTHKNYMKPIKTQITWAQLFVVQGAADFLVAPDQGKD